MDSLQDDAARVEALGVLSRFRVDFHGCLTARGDELSELADALLCTEGPVKTLVGLSLAPEHRRGHGALYDGVNRGRIDFARLRRTLAGLPLPRAADGRLMLAVDVSNWLRPGAATSPDRLFCHVYARGKGQAQMIPGWPYSVVAALEPGRTSWTAVLDAVRLGPDDDETDVTAAQVRDVVGRLIAAGQHRDGDPDVLVVFDAGYDVTRLAFLLADLPVELLGRLRSDRGGPRPAPRSTRYAPAPARPPPSTASRGSSGLAPSRGRRRGRTADPGWSPRPAAASCSHPPPASGGHQPPVATAARPGSCAAARNRSARDSPRHTARRDRAGAQAPATTRPMSSPGPRCTAARRPARIAHRRAGAGAYLVDRGAGRGPPRPRRR